MSSGFLYIHKPLGMTSHDVVDAVRRITGEKRVGHAGTLDPFAEGLLIVAVGREATAKLSTFLKQPKTYRATMRLGAISSTDDPEGEIRAQPCSPPSRRAVRAIVEQFTGDIEQTPPAYSAIKVKGRRAYKLARAGQAPELKKRRVRIHRITLLGYDYPELEFEAEVSSGTYIRSLARDIGSSLGCGGYLIKLVRLKIGETTLKQAIPLQELTVENWEHHLRSST